MDLYIILGSQLNMCSVTSDETEARNAAAVVKGAAVGLSFLADFRQNTETAGNGPDRAFIASMLREWTNRMEHAFTVDTVDARRMLNIIAEMRTLAGRL